MMDKNTENDRIPAREAELAAASCSGSDPSRVISYPYNESFRYYGEPRAGKRAQEFIDRKNREKGGVWVLHTKEQYDEWYRKVGQHQEYVRYFWNL